MSFEIKQIEVVPYNSDWPKMFEEEAALIREALGAHCLAIHHIGSTSVPGLSAKPYLDVMCIVSDLSFALNLQKIGYVFKGEYNIPLRYGFTKKTSNRKVNLHVVERDHGFIPLNLCFRDYLRTHDESRQAYENLKHDLLRNPESHEKRDHGFTGYNLGKDHFIKGILEKAGFNDFILNVCMHNLEWAAYYRICQEQHIADVHPNNSSSKTENHHHFVFYKGIHIVCVAYVEMLHKHEAVLRWLATDKLYKKKGYEVQMMMVIEKWVKQQGITDLSIHQN